jgi:hypothetical protein
VSQVVLSPNPEPGFCASDEPTRFQLLAADVGVSEANCEGSFVG